jgi:Domain of unknown function (DUF5668)
MEYVHNRSCTCPRCRSRRFMGPAVLVTLGVLFLVDEFTRFDFDQSWPLLLIVIGLVKVLQWNTPAPGHVNPGEALAQPPPQSDDQQVRNA